MKNLLKTVSSLLLSHGCLLIGNGLFMTLLSLRANLEGFSTELIGLIMSGYFVGLFIGARYSSKLVSRVGYIRAFSAFASLISITPLLHLFWVSPAFWFTLRVFAGFAMAGMLMVTESWLNASANNKNRGSLLAIYMVISFLGAGMAQLLLFAHDPSDYQLFTLTSIFFSLCLLPVTLTKTPAPQPDPSGPLKILPTLRNTPVGFYGAICAGLMNASFNTMGPLFALELGLSAGQISMFMALGICSGLVLQSPIGKLSDRIERRKVIVMVSTLVSLCCLIITLQVIMGYQLSWLLISIFLYGSLAFTTYSLAAAHCNDWADPERRMQTTGALLVGFSIGAISGPLISGSLMGLVGPAGLFSFIGIIALLLALYTLSKISDKHTRSRLKSPYIPRPGSYYTSGELYRAVQKSSKISQIEAEEDKPRKDI